MTRRLGPTLAERSATSADGRTPSAEPLVDGRHCWVVDAPGHPGRYPGLLVEWRQEGDGWVGRVIYALPDTGAARPVERWVPAWYLHAGDALPAGG